MRKTFVEVSALLVQRVVNVKIQVKGKICRDDNDGYYKKALMVNGKSLVDIIEEKLGEKLDSGYWIAERETHEGTITIEIKRRKT